jgi:dihydroorotate dehydrogenase
MIASLLRLLPPESAHETTLRMLESGFHPRGGGDDPILATRVCGLEFPNPVGLAAGFDKDARVPDAMLSFGFGFVEVGSVTPRAQLGNPRPRLFRLVEDRAVINRMGFNNGGLDAAAARLSARRRVGLVGANIGKNRDSADPFDDYVQGVMRLAPFSDFLVVNVSSPNTPGLRDLQRRSTVATLIERLLAARARATPTRPPPLLVKIAPDLGHDERADIAEVALGLELDGLIVANTTVARPPELRSRHAPEPGGLSGRPLLEASTEVLADMHRLTQGHIPLVGVGGVSSGADAYAKIRAGASLVELYTALVYEGPFLVRRIKRELAALLRRDGFGRVADAVGVDVRRAGAVDTVKN